MTILESITPLVLTFNEEPNIADTLARLAWAKRVVVVDSMSTDATTEVVRGVPNAVLFQRAFDSHAAQWGFGLESCGISSEWVLALDADYKVTEDFVADLRRLQPPTDVAAYQAAFVYCVFGRCLRGTAYPPVSVLYRRQRARYVQDGHTQRLVIDGRTERLRARLLHDDRKPLAHWIQSQARYMRLEADKLRASGVAASLSDRIRRMRVVAPFAMPFYCLFVRGGILDGRAGVFYALQRMFAETLLSLFLLEADVRTLMRPAGKAR